MNKQLNEVMTTHPHAEDLQATTYDMPVDLEYTRILQRCAELATHHKVSAEVIILDKNLAELKTALELAGFVVEDLGSLRLTGNRGSFCSILCISWERTAK